MTTALCVDFNEIVGRPEPKQAMPQRLHHIEKGGC